MPYQFVPYTVFLMASAIMTSALAAYGAKHRRTLGTNILGLCMAIGTLWSCANALELSALTLEHKLLWANLQYVAYSLGPVAWFLTSCQFSGRAHWLKRNNVLALLVIPIFTILLVWLDPWWGLVRTTIRLDTSGPISVIAKQYGPWFWVHFAHSYALNFASMFVLIQALTKKSSIYRRQAIFLLTGIILVVFSNLLYVLGLSPVTDYDLTPLVFSIAAGLMFWGIYRCDLFRLVPIAWDKVLEAMDTAVVVMNNQGRIVDYNPAFRRMFASENTQLLGMFLGDLCPELVVLWPEVPSEVGKHLELQREIQGRVHYYEVSISEISDHRSIIQGKVMAINEITELKLALERLGLEQQGVAVAAERARFTQDLHDNLGQILGFCSLQVQVIARELERGNNESAVNHLRRLGEVLDEAQNTMRTFVHGMRTREYERTSLTALLTKELDRLSEHQHFAPERVSLDITPYDFPVETKIQLCGIVKEALNNVRKHSKADSVQVSLRPSGENWLMTIIDNGIGFNPKSTLAFSRGASGLSIMSERALLVGGELQIDSRPGRTEISVKFPQKGGTEHADYDCRRSSPLC